MLAGDVEPAGTSEPRVGLLPAIGEQAEQLRKWLGPIRVTPRFRTPLERELSA